MESLSQGLLAMTWRERGLQSLLCSRSETAVLELRLQPRPLGRRQLDIGFLYVPEAADLRGHAREPCQQRELLRLQPGHPLIDHRQIIRDQLPLGPALLSAAER